MYIRNFFAAPMVMLAAFQISAALAQSAIGSVEAVQNPATGTIDGKPLSIAVGDRVYENEVVRTGEGSNVKIVFLDGTDLSIGPNSRVTLDRFVYNSGYNSGRIEIQLDPALESGQFEVEVSRGALTSVARSDDKKDYEVIHPIDTKQNTGVFRFLKRLYEIVTPSGTIHVRG